MSEEMTLKAKVHLDILMKFHTAEGKEVVISLDNFGRVWTDKGKTQISFKNNEDMWVSVIVSETCQQVQNLVAKAESERDLAYKKIKIVMT